MNITWDGRDVDPDAVLQDLQARRAVRDQQRQNAIVAVRAAPQHTLPARQVVGFSK